MCSIEEAWGSNNTFQGEKVFSQGDVHNQYMNTPENLNYPSMNYGPMTKTLPNKNRFSRGVHSKLSRTARMNPKEYKNRGQNGNVDVKVTPDYSAMNQNVRADRPNYLDLFPKPVDMIPSADKYPLPVKSNVPQPLNTSEDEDFTPWNEAFTVSSTVDHFMNNGLTSPEDITDEEELGIYGDEYRKYEVTDDVYHREVDSQKHRNRRRGRTGPTEEETSKTEDIVAKHLKEQKEVLLLLNKIIGRIDKLEKNMKTQPTYTKSDVAIYAIVASIVSIVVFILVTKIIKLLKKD
jgi:hypothetical protein